MQPPVIIALTMLGCCANVVLLELITSVHPGSGNIVTCCQFAFIAIHGFIVTMRFGREPSHIPMSAYVVLVVLFFSVSVINNYALNFGIPMPLHIIFKSGSLVVNMLMGMVVLERVYPRHKKLAVIGITIGICISSYATNKSSSEDESVSTSFGTMTVGVALLTTALLLSARLGIFQEVLYNTHGHHSQQALFFTHALPLPGFLLLASDIGHHAALFSASAPLQVPLLATIPRLWLFLAFNCLTQYVCISSVFHLTEQCTSLTVTLVVTLRKFISLLLSVWYFGNTFTTTHWLGAGVVFAGTLVFADPVKCFQSEDAAPAGRAHQTRVKAQ